MSRGKTSELANSASTACADLPSIITSERFRALGGVLYGLFLFMLAPRRQRAGGQDLLQGNAAACDPSSLLGRLGASGRVVRAADGPGLENQWAAMSRGFESHTLRNAKGGPRRGPPYAL